MKKPFVPGCEHDLFVSYACVDDKVPSADETGWVSTLVAGLEVRLSQLLGRREVFSIWKDEQLAHNVDISAQIASTLERTALFLVVLSPGYMKSDWCRRERVHFLQWVHERLSNNARVFVVEREPVEGSRPNELGKPAEFAHLLSYKFWTETSVRKARPLDRSRDEERAEFDDLVNNLAHDVAKELMRLKELGGLHNTNHEAPTLPSTAERVFLAEVTDDLASMRRRVKTHFEQLGLTCIVPDVALLWNEQGCRTSLEQGLSQADIFVQLLSTVPGRLAPGTKSSLAVFQLERALAQKKVIYQWRDPAINEATYNPTPDPHDEISVVDHRKLLFGANVQAVNLEDFKQSVVAYATRPKRKPTPNTGNALVFVNYHRAADQDRILAESLVDYLRTNGYGVITPPDPADVEPDMLREEFENNLEECHGLVVVHGDGRLKLWVRQQLRETYKVLCGKDKAAMALCAGPPPPKDASNPVGYMLPEMSVIDCQKGFEAQRFEEFLKAMSERLKTPLGAELQMRVVV